MFNLVRTLTNQEDEGEGKSSSNPVDQFVNEEFEDRLNRLEERFRSGSSEEQVQQAYEKILPAFRARSALGERTEQRGNVYLTDYKFLTDCYKYLTETQDEGFCLVTGPEMEEDVYALTRRIEPEMRRQGPAGAEPDLGSLNRLLDKIDEGYGAHLSGYFHSHPGTGSGSTGPSSIDLKTQERLERGGYPVIGCIFSRDGYLRFYSESRDFQLEVSGNGGEQIERRTFKLKKDKVHKVS
ncbi:hypothetical protein KGY79_10145 [Candidatus Bipolaricaulota bacterium]|nr:hypothetical protein [Candidatus Bipolaricaulota bacterium]